MIKKTFLASLVITLIVAKSAYSIEPIINAQSAILVDVQSGRVLLEYNPHIKLPMASTTKIMTALVALENSELKDKVEVDESAVDIEGSSIYLYEGEVLTMEDLLYGLMLRSGNDASIAVANHVGGSVQKFNAMMNNKARDIGATNTYFANPHGLHDNKHYSTAYDLALITRKALNLNDFKKISSAKSWKAKRDRNNFFYNKNKTLWEYQGGDGIKIGYTKNAGRCLVASATKGTTQLVSVVLNDRNWFEDAYRLMDYGFQHFNTYVIFDKQQYIKNIEISNSDMDTIPVTTKDRLLYPLKDDELDRIKIDVDLPLKVDAPIKKSDPVGKIRVFLDGRTIYEGKLISGKNAKALGFIRKLIKRI